MRYASPRRERACLDVRRADLAAYADRLRPMLRRGHNVAGPKRRCAAPDIIERRAPAVIGVR